MIMDELITHIPLCMLLADYIILVSESRDGVNVKFWREGLESKGTKNEYMNYCDFSGGVQNE